MIIILVTFLWLEVVHALVPNNRREHASILADRSFRDSALTLPAQSAHHLISKGTVITSRLKHTPHYLIEATCDASRKASIVDAWAEAKLLTDAQTKVKPGYSYNIPHTQWLGKEWSSEKPNYRKTLDENFRRLAWMFEQTPQSTKNVYWHCDDITGRCAEGLDAYSWHDSKGHYTVFCDSFHVRESIDELLEVHSHDKQQQKIMENFRSSKGQIMLRQIWAYLGVTTEERISYPQAVWDLARNENATPAYVNADSFVLDAVAIYVQQHYRSSMSPIPFRELRKLNPSTKAPDTEHTENISEGRTFNPSPAQWTSRLKADSQMTSESWEETSPPQSSSRFSSAFGPLAAQVALIRADASH